MGRIAEIEARLAEIATALNAEGADVDALNTETDNLIQERKGLVEAAEQRSALLDKIAKQTPAKKLASAPAPVEPDVMEQRGADLRAGKQIVLSGVESRSMLISDGEAIVEKKYSRNLPDAPNEVSSLVDRVNSFDVMGGESYTTGFAKTEGEGNYRATEDGDYTEAEVTFGYVEIGKTNITAYTEISKSFKVLPNADYSGKVMNGIRNALRKKITKQIISGAGTTGTIKGVYNADAACAVKDVDIAAIDANTLTAIVFGLGGDEDVNENAVLILNKTDLKAFADVRGTNEKKAIYKITMNGNTGTIGYAEGGIEVPYIINSACTATASASTGAYSMVFGALNTYEMPIFSPMTIEMSTDYKFKSGMIAYRGDVYIGGAVAAYKSFVRVKKAAQ